jgi:hypothetical protein
MALIPPERLQGMRIADLRLRVGRLRRREQFLMAALMLEEEQQAHEQRRRRTVWVKPWLQRRPLLGQYDTLMMELMRESRGDFKSYLRMEQDMFREVLDRVGPRITKSMDRRRPLEPGLKLAITLRFLATGNSYHSLAFDFRVAHNTISLFVPEVCDAIVAEYKDEQFTTPTTEAEWAEVATKFGRRWNFHHCCGALDGKHVEIKKPKKSGSRYFNYKGFFSVVLLGLVDADYNFLWANVGCPGSESDCGIFNRSSLEPALREGTLGLPPPAPLPHDDQDTSFFIVGDDAFPLRSYMVKPYPHRFLNHDERIFNYRCSRARRVVENAFGILAGRFRCLHTSLQVTPLNAKKITKACLVLHNIMRDRHPNLQNADLDVEGQDGHVIPGAWRNAGVMQEMGAVGRGPRATQEGKQLRTYLKHYYCSDVGSVPWQEAAINAPLK